MCEWRATKPTDGEARHQSVVAYAVPVGGSEGEGREAEGRGKGRDPALALVLALVDVIARSTEAIVAWFHLKRPRERAV